MLGIAVGGLVISKLICCKHNAFSCCWTTLLTQQPKTRMVLHHACGPVGWIISSILSCCLALIMKLVNQMALRETAMAARGCTGQFDGLSHWSVCWYVLKYVLSILPFLACFYLMEHSSAMLSMLGIFPPFRLHTTFLTSS